MKTLMLNPIFKKVLERSLRPSFSLAAAAFFISTGTQAHVTLEEPAAVANTGYKAVLRITHGCEGSATHTVRVQIPAGFLGTKPIPKPGWKLELQRVKLSEPYDSHGRKIDETVSEVIWRAQSPEVFLADAHYDEFVLRGQTPAKPGVIWFKVQQVCEKGELNWGEVPSTGSSAKGLKAPAARLEVLPGLSGGGGHQH
jgi:uncharacterized protein YcnI